MYMCMYKYMYMYEQSSNLIYRTPPPPSLRSFIKYHFNRKLILIVHILRLFVIVKACKLLSGSATRPSLWPVLACCIWPLLSHALVTTVIQVPQYMASGESRTVTIVIQVPQYRHSRPSTNLALD